MLTKKTFWIYLIIIVCVAAIAYGTWSGIVHYIISNNPYSLEYVCFLHGYDLSLIQGKPTAISKEKYATKIKTIKEETPFLPVEYLFPDEISNNEAIFFYFAETITPRSVSFYRIELYVECRWNFEEFEEEKERLETIEADQGNSILSNSLFQLPSYILVYNSISHFHYALIDEDNYLIRYISLVEIGSLDNIVFDMEFAPTKRMQDSDVADYSKFGKYSIV